ESSVPSARRWRGLLQVPLGAVSFGPFRKPSFGFAIAAGATVEQWRILADAEVWLPQQVAVVLGPDRYSARVRRFSVGLRACRSLTGPRVQVAPCALVSAEHASARGRGPS